MSGLLAGLLAVSGLVLALLAMPVACEFELSSRDRSRRRVRLRFCFGLLTLDLLEGGRRGAGSRAGLAAPPGREEAAARGEGGGERSAGRGRREGEEAAAAPGPGRFLAALREPGFVASLLRSARRLWRSLHAEGLRLQARVGLGDPADTGQLWALFGPLSALLAQLRGARITLVPDFVERTLEFEGSGSVRVSPLRVLGVMLGMLGSPAIWRGMRRLRPQHG